MTDKMSLYWETKYPQLANLNNTESLRQCDVTDTTVLGNFSVNILDFVPCQVCGIIPAAYWKCRECKTIECYNCMIKRHKLRRGAYQFKCSCGSTNIFYKHNIHTIPFVFRI
jgi:hypothetical protein